MNPIKIINKTIYYLTVWILVKPVEFIAWAFVSSFQRLGKKDNIDIMQDRMNEAWKGSESNPDGTRTIYISEEIFNGMIVSPKLAEYIRVEGDSFVVIKEYRASANSITPDRVGTRYVMLK